MTRANLSDPCMESETSYPSFPLGRTLPPLSNQSFLGKEVIIWYHIYSSPKTNPFSF
ncbi:hypothetical protein NITGR_1050038 [Nitrospina gracilis 3/211]|uniref:Uncharacterized protein n=1 Tax=Nitrospina gracilis (strain 3/211) TaxID=1266370 RepID=M1Z8S8_NITG3|nr:hypothetical protein NITGR_1050038 [Nitrospina gracilis 3/211]